MAELSSTKVHVKIITTTYARRDSVRYLSGQHVAQSLSKDIKAAKVIVACKQTTEAILKNVATAKLVVTSRNNGVIILTGREKAPTSKSAHAILTTRKKHFFLIFFVGGKENNSEQVSCDNEHRHQGKSAAPSHDFCFGKSIVRAVCAVRTASHVH